MLANGAIGGDQPGGSGLEAVDEAAAAASAEEEVLASAGRMRAGAEWHAESSAESLF